MISIKSIHWSQVSERAKIYKYTKAHWYKTGMLLKWKALEGWAADHPNLERHDKDHPNQDILNFCEVK